jgi:hypothetical protein
MYRFVYCLFITVAYCKILSKMLIARIAHRVRIHGPISEPH